MRRKLSIDALSKRTGITTKRLERFEKAERSPYIDELFSLANAFRVQPSFIARKIWDSTPKKGKKRVAAVSPS